MAWFVLALGVALIQAFKEVLMKRAGLSGPSVVLGYSLVMVLLLAPLALFGPVRPDGVGAVGAREWLAAWLGLWPLLPIMAALAAVSFYGYFHALTRTSDLSLTVPMLAFSPLFMLLSSPLILGEFPAPLGLAGMCLVVAGSWVLQFSQRRRGLFAPFTALLADPGPRWMLFVAVLWSVGANLDKLGLRRASSPFWLFSVLSLICVLLLPYCLWKDRSGLRRVVRRPMMAILGGLETVSLLLQMAALRLELAPYVISVKRLSVFFGVLLGAWLFKERGLGERLAGALVMLAGVTLILFG